MHRVRVDVQQQAIDTLAADNMAAKDFLDIGFRFVFVPDAFGVNHHGWPVLADVKATGVVDANAADARRHPKSAHVVAQCFASLAGTAAPAVGGRPLVGTTEHVQAI